MVAQRLSFLNRTDQVDALRPSMPQPSDDLENTISCADLGHIMFANTYTQNAAF